MLSPFLLYRAASLALFIVCNAVICSVAAWNLGFAQSDHHDLASLVQIDSFLLFAGASGLVIVFTVIFIEVCRKGAISSRVWFELSWLTLLWLFNFAGATAITAVAPRKMCSSSNNNNSDHSHHTDSACTSARVLIVFAWLNTGFLFVYFFLLMVFAILHQKEDGSVWRATVCDFPWFATKQCIRSAPNSPIIARFVKSTMTRAASASSAHPPPSFVVPKPRRAPPPPMFIHGRAGLGSQVEIEYFSDIGSIEEQRGVADAAAAATAIPPPGAMAAPPSAALSFYPQHVQSTMQRPTTTTYHQDNTYYTSKRTTSSSPPPIRDWPRPIGAISNGDGNQVPSSSSQQRQQQQQQSMSERAAQKQRAPPAAPAVVSRSGSDASSHSDSSSQRGGGGGHRTRAPPPPPLALGRTTTKESANTTSATQAQTQTQTQTQTQDSPSRSRPTGPRTRTRSGSSGFVRPRPPPLDLTRAGATPNSRR